MSKPTKVFLREENRGISVKITGDDKPLVSGAITEKWQLIINTIAKILKIPAGLIMKINQNNIEVFLASESEGNPYKKSASDSLGHGLYCETVIGRNQPLVIENALKNEIWKDNPDVKINMISYIGLPLKWPDGEVFGTICVLDKKAIPGNQDYLDLMSHMKSLIESDLKDLLRDADTKNAENLRALRLRELHHRMKNQFSIISMMIQQKYDDTDPSTQQILEDIDSKIRSAALMHSKLSESTEIHTSITDYIKEVIRISLLICKSPVEFISEIDTEIKIDPIHMLDFGLLFSELVTNSIKYGLPSKDAQIFLHINLFSADGNEYYKILYKDNGPGFPEDFLNGQGKEGIGSMMLRSFQAKFKGSVKKFNDHGAVTEIILPKINE
jgi:c-di-GMP phosphodiesterase